MRISLPDVVVDPNTPAKAHPYPLRIAHQAQRFLQAAAFHAGLLDIAAGERVRQPNALEEIRSDLFRQGLDEETWELSWGVIAEYRQVFEFWTFQTVVISLRSHWDWYVRRLSEFVKFSRDHVPCPAIASKMEKALAAIGVQEFKEQLRLLEVATGVALMPTQDVLDAITLMTHIRNLGLHNRWEVDQRFLSSHPECGLQLGELRRVDPAELSAWSGALRQLVTSTAVAIGKKFVTAPAYP